ncbi:hypothetical protein PTW35_26315 (plasmid) [Photobacterium sp. DA100]|uniref:hypothetical protein n=1 Tax=Photobacterium sp. DA100 TaxID=3027472 RepID=UPI00247869B8|nr:hypothetical protein [Photobacterium sp. DA100]WEM44771.1 hypothetical protein PTW35_26315 [Photobacterium sp. DA100]
MTVKQTLFLTALTLLCGCEMRNQFELDAEADPQKLIAITHFGTTATNHQGENGFRVYLRNASPREIQSMTFHVRAFNQQRALVGGNKQSGEQGGLKALRFNQPLKPGGGAHPLWDNVWTQGVSSSTSIVCATIESAEIAYKDGTMAIIPKQALDTMTYNPKCLSLDGAEFDYGAN